MRNFLVAIKPIFIKMSDAFMAECYNKIDWLFPEKRTYLPEKRAIHCLLRSQHNNTSSLIFCHKQRHCLGVVWIIPYAYGIAFIK
jgi:hypothetical protein